MFPCYTEGGCEEGVGEGEGTRLYFSAFSIQLPLNSLLPANKETTSNNNQNNSIVLHLSGSKIGGGGGGGAGGMEVGMSTHGNWRSVVSNCASGHRKTLTSV